MPGLACFALSLVSVQTRRTVPIAIDQIIRCASEFNFRDAKQFWGLEDFMNVTQTAVTNAANLALFMVNLSFRLLVDFPHPDSQASLLDLKAHYRGSHYVTEILKLLPHPPEPILLTRLFNHVAALGRIHPAPFFPLGVFML